MYVQGLKLLNFRNYIDLELRFDSDTVILFGQNAQGKTNILEAIYICSCLRSHRTYRDSDLITHGKDEYAIYLDFFEPDGSGFENNFTESISVAYYDVVSKDPYRDRPRRIMKHNGMMISRAADIVGVFNAVIFAPEDLNIIKEGPAIRRRYLDMLISQIRSSYFSELLIYQKTLSHRNTQLKRIRDGIELPDYSNIEVWDMALASSASKIIMTRYDFSEKISRKAAERHKMMASGKEEINIRYRSIPGISLESGLEEMQIMVYEKLKNNFYEDVERGSTSYGPHRDDLEISLGGESVRNFASQGQQRTAVLALKIAELEIIAEETGSMPVLLLDDVMSELDETRRRQLISSIGSAQVILTCTDSAHAAPELTSLDPERKVKYFEVSDGSVLPVNMV